MRVAVTGASGFAGGALCRRLVRAGCQVYPFDLRMDVDPEHVGGSPVRPWDISARRLADPPEVDAVVHVAAYVSDTGTVDAARAVNVGGTANVVATFPGVRFVHISTCSVYDPHLPQVMAKESEAPDPDQVRWSNAYGRTKSEAERLLARIRPDAIVLRPHAIYGPGDTTLQPRIRHAARHGLIPVPGDGRQWHSVTSVENLVEACLLACGPHAQPGTYNVTDAEPMHLADSLALMGTAPGGSRPRIQSLPESVMLAAAAASELTSRLAGRIGGSPQAPALSRYTVEHFAKERTFDISAAREGLGYRPAATTLQDAPSW
jgi:nucleoside-diphosphate-sugar epimerase